MEKKRDYKAEYQRRIKRGLAKGLSKSQARGHPKAGEASAAPVRASSAQTTGRDPGKSEELSISLYDDPRLEEGFRALRRGISLQKAAKKAGVSRERLRRFIGENDLADWRKRKWVVTDKRPRRVLIISRGRIIDVAVPNLEEATRAGEFWDAQGRFIRSNDRKFLTPFEGTGVTDVKGKFHAFETDPNELHRIASMEGPVFHEIYQISAN